VWVKLKNNRLKDKLIKWSRMSSNLVLIFHNQGSHPIILII
jgi:hypothetical protein